MNAARHALFAFALALLILPAQSVVAATPAPASAGLDVRLVRPWFGGQTPLDLEAQVSSAGGTAVDNLRITVAVYERARSRSDLERAFDGKLPRTPLAAFTTTLPQLPAGGGQRVRLTRTVDDLGALQQKQDGLYPLTVSLRSQSGAVIATSTTAVAYVGEAPRLPLRVAPVLVIAPRPLLRPDGTPDKRVAERLETMRRQLATETKITSGVAVSGVLADELRVLRNAGPLRDEASAVEAALRARVANNQPVGLPYAYGRLGQIADLTGSAGLREQLDLGRSAVQRLIGADQATTLYLPDLDAGGKVLAAVADAGYRAAITAGSHLASIARGLTPTEAATSDGVLLIPADIDMTRRLSRARTGLERSRVVAMTAMVYFESPARQRTLILPGDNLDAFTAVTSLLADAPWVKFINPSDATSAPANAIKSASFSTPDKSPASMRRELTEARRGVSELASITLEGNPIVGALQTALRTGLGTQWWGDSQRDGIAWASGVRKAVAVQRKLIATVGASPVTFTSRGGSVPVTIVNRTDYQIRVRVEINSPKLRFPGGSSRNFAALDPPGETITFRAITNATGTFPLQVRLLSPDGSVLVDEARFVVRSTAYNIGALVLFVVTGLFLTISLVRRLVARRRRKSAA